MATTSHIGGGWNSLSFSKRAAPALSCSGSPQNRTFPRRQSKPLIPRTPGCQPNKCAVKQEPHCWSGSNPMMREDDDNTYASWDEYGTLLGSQISITSDYCPLNISLKTIKRFNVMVAGSAGAGKSTFCRATFCKHFPHFTMVPLEGPTLEIGVCGQGKVVVGKDRIIVTVIDSVGGYHPQKHIKETAEYLENQHLEYEQKELYRKKYDSSEDTRVACLFYFFGAHRVHDEDISFLKALHNKVPIVPIVSKADSLTTCELAEQLRLIREKLTESQIQYFDFGETDIDEDWLTAPSDRNAFSNQGRNTTEGAASNQAAPVHARPMIRNVFAVISGCRQYMWGTAREGDPNHSDTIRLQRVFFGNMAMLLENMEEIHQKWLDEKKKAKKKKDDEKKKDQCNIS